MVIELAFSSWLLLSLFLITHLCWVVHLIFRTGSFSCLRVVMNRLRFGGNACRLVAQAPRGDERWTQLLAHWWLLDNQMLDLFSVRVCWAKLWHRAVRRLMVDCVLINNGLTRRWCCSWWFFIYNWRVSVCGHSSMMTRTFIKSILKNWPSATLIRWRLICLPNLLIIVQQQLLALLMVLSCFEQCNSMHLFWFDDGVKVAGFDTLMKVAWLIDNLSNWAMLNFQVNFFRRFLIQTTPIIVRINNYLVSVDNFLLLS